MLPPLARLQQGAPAALRSALARADALPRSEPGMAEAVAAMLTLPGLPWASLLARERHPDTVHDWLIADLVAVKADSDTARVIALGVDELDDATAQQLYAALEPWLAEEGIAMDMLAPGRALLRLPQAISPPTALSPEALLGLDLRLGMPPELVWQRRINEMQIVLSQHPLNTQRSHSGARVFNTLWFWGGGASTQLLRRSLPAVASSDPLLRALASQCAAAVLSPDTIGPRGSLYDLRVEADLQAAWSAGLRPRNALLRSLDGHGWRLRLWHRLRLWRRVGPIQSRASA